MSAVDPLLKRLFFGRVRGPWQWPAHVAQEDWEPVWLEAAAGARLAGLYGAPARRQAQGAVVLAHPLCAAAKGFWLEQGHAPLLRRLGFHVLAFDFNGFGESPSTTFDYPGDVLAAGAYLQRRAGTRALAVLGTSFGAAWALCAMAHREQPYRAAVLEGLFPTLAWFWRDSPLRLALLHASRWVSPRLEQQLRPIASASLLEGAPEVLLVYGEGDTRTPPQVGEQLRAQLARRAHVALWTVPAAAHNLALPAAPQAWTRTVGGFLAYALELQRPPF